MKAASIHPKVPDSSRCKGPPHSSLPATHLTAPSHRALPRTQLRLPGPHTARQLRTNTMRRLRGVSVRDVAGTKGLAPRQGKRCMRCQPPLARKATSLLLEGGEQVPISCYTNLANCASAWTIVPLAAGRSKVRGEALKTPLIMAELRGTTDVFTKMS
ncbi:hypothetical protein E2C01_046266 [Portunus trituberculatus]|uniref:Uncharacterized protein n=1 Tax=Portunus trituberculatus TaxID=210409 RepID=A0A5B7G5I4_PORTR|nr:hypothetical protein [Portunus trituberculatus]